MRALFVTSGGITGSLAQYAATISGVTGTDSEATFVCDGRIIRGRRTFSEALISDRGSATRVPNISTVLSMVRTIGENRVRNDLVEFCSQRYFYCARDPMTDLLVIPDVFPYGLKELEHQVWQREQSGLSKLIRNMALAYNISRLRRNRFRVITHTKYTRDALVRYFDYPEELIEVMPYPLASVYEGPVQDAPAARLHARETLGLPLDGPIVLSVGSDLPRKNMGAFYYLLSSAEEDVYFVRIGPLDYRQVKHGCRSRLLQLQGVSPEEMRMVYESADLLFFPSYAEGFGVPLAEAMTCGVPIVAADSPATVEVAGDAAMLGSPNRYQDLAQSAMYVAHNSDVRERLRRKGLARAQSLKPSKVLKRYRAFHGVLRVDGESNLETSRVDPRSLFES